MVNITYHIKHSKDKRPKRIECEIKNKNVSRVTTDYETVVGGLQYISELDYNEVSYLHGAVTFKNDSREVTIEDYDEIMKMVDPSIHEAFQKIIKNVKNKEKNKVKKSQPYKIVTASGLAVATLAGIAIMKGNVPQEPIMTLDAATLEKYANIETVDLDEEIIEPTSSTIPEEYINDEVEEQIIDIVEAPVIEESTAVVASIPTPTVTSDNRIYIKGVKQTGICRDYTCYTTFYNRWNDGTNQRLVADIWNNQGRTSDRGIATLDGRYLVAMTTTFGNVGDYVDVVLEDGTVIPCIIADAKSFNDHNCNAYGHEKGRRGTSLVEFESIEPVQDSIDTTGWQGKAVSYIQLKPGITILNPVVTEDEINDYEYSDETIDIIINELENELDAELASLLEQYPEPVIIEDQYEEPITEEVIVR